MAAITSTRNTPTASGVLRRAGSEWVGKPAWARAVVSWAPTLALAAFRAAGARLRPSIEAMLTLPILTLARLPAGAGWLA